MKQRIKQLLLLLCMIACFFTLSACSAQEDEAEEVDPMIAAQLNMNSEELLKNITSLAGEEAQEQEAALLKNRQTVLANAVTTWINTMKDTGAFAEIVGESRTEETEDGEYCTTVTAQFEKRQAEFKVFYSMEGMITSISLSPEYTLAEKMQKALMNTVMGMGTVFLVLIFICLIISCFKYINTFTNKPKEAPQAAVSVPVVQPPAVEKEEELADDLELVAVITAAIAASANTSADGLVVRSIKRAPGAKWKRA